jgi:hypothetical protein
MPKSDDAMLPDAMLYYTSMPKGKRHIMPLKCSLAYCSHAWSRQPQTLLCFIFSDTCTPLQAFQVSARLLSIYWLHTPEWRREVLATALVSRLMME